RLRKIIALMRSAAFPTIEGCRHQCLCRVKSAPQLEPLDQAAIMNLLARYAGLRQIAFAHGADARECLTESPIRPKRSNLTPHHILEPTQEPRGRCALAGIPRAHIANEFQMYGGRCIVPSRFGFSARKSGGSLPCPFAEHNGFRQRIAGEAIGAVGAADELSRRI